ncbi:Telomere-associated protein RIF1 [Anthophora retusa]
MASNMQSFPRMLKMLRENSNVKEKREALTYIRSNSKKLESTKAIKEEQYKELCKLVVDAFANGNSDIQNEAYETLNVIIREFKDHTLNLFEALSRISQKNRLKILKLLEVVEDNAIATFAYDAHAVNFFNNCMCTVQTNTMPWTAPTACVDNIQALIDAESRPLSDDQRLEEETINYCITLLRRLYKVAASDIKVQRFNVLLMDKVILLAYMGHKRQRGPALKLLQQALAANILSHVHNKLSVAWARYISALQSVYCKRMLLLVTACELDWATQWNVSIQFLGVDLHRGAGLINNLLSVEEKAFKSTDTIIRRQAFLSWKLLVDNFALDPQELATARRIKLLCIPLNAKNSKTELIALTKLEVWWHVIIKLYKDISKFVNPVITQFLDFCFGPLGDTPLLSSKFDIVASPGKRFFKTKVVAVDALCQLLVNKQENHSVFSPILEERLPHSISNAVFQECYKRIIHSVGEALLVLSQLTDAEMKNRYQLGKILWTSLISYVQESKTEEKEIMYKDVILVITELANYAGTRPMIRNLILDIIVFEIADLSKDFNFQDDVLSGLVFKLLQISILNEAEKKHYNALKCLLWQCIKSQKENVYYTHAFNYLKQVLEKLQVLASAEDRNRSVIFELWLILADILTKYMDDIQEINEGTATEHNLSTVESIVIFPFMYICLEDQKQVQELAKTWKYLYKQFEMRTDLMTTVKSNEILLNIANTMQQCLTENEKSSYLTIYCLDLLLSTMNYKLLLVHTEVPCIIYLLVDLVTCFLSNKNIKHCESALKALSAVIITIYGHNPEKVTPYLQVCKPAMELILQSELEPLYREIGSTWESLITIFKGLGKAIEYDLLSTYKQVIIQALSHPNLDIQIQTAALFELQNVLNGSTKLILEEIEKESGRSKILHKTDIAKKKNDQTGKLPNQVKIVDSILRRSSSPKFVAKETDKNDKKVLNDSDSQDYVFIKTDLKFDVNRLTEHQKESLKRRREDIPALYNDLSQSSSQDTQNLQEWFDKKSKMLQETEKGHNRKENVTIENILDDDANKENKIERKESETINKSNVESDTKATESIGHVSLESVQKPKDTDSNENSFVESELITTEKHYDNVEAKTSADLESKELNSNAEEESSENKDDQRLSPSVLDSSKRRNRFSAAIRSSVSQKSEEIVSNQPGQSNITQVLQRTLRTKVAPSKSEVINKQKNLDNVEHKSVKEDKRGVKRKSASDSENEGTSLRQRRKTASLDLINDNDSFKSTENDHTAMCFDEIMDEGNLSQRTRNEISRLRINMVFDSPLSTCRRFKGHDDVNKDTITKKQSPENRSGKLKVAVSATGDILKKLQKTNDKELNSISKNRRQSRIKKIEKNTEVNKLVDTKKAYQNKRNELKEEKKKEESVQADVSKSISDDKCNLLDTDNYAKINDETVGMVETVNDDKPNSETQSVSINQDVKCTEEKSQTQEDTEDIIENSQELSQLEKKCNEKQCCIKISKIEKIFPLMKCPDVTIEDEEVAKIVSNNCDNDNNEVPKDNVKEIVETNEVNLNVPKISTPVIENNSYDSEKDICEGQKGNEGSLLKSLFEFSSPKDDEPAIKKAKSKDTDNDALLWKKEQGSTSKDIDKVTATCSSRQEKIFNNMRSVDYCSSPPIKLFSNLKNDGEKVFSKIDKSVDCVSLQTDAQTDKVGEEVLLETEELPILGWSSANPPSLTASPTASILKRQRQSIPEPDPESTTPNKRKRVSFADPPVSKEMGYETACVDSPHKANKFISRGLFIRKDSPLMAKQVRQKFISVDLDKMNKEEVDVTNGSEVDLQCERENELLTKIAEELEYSENATTDTDVQTSCNFAEDESTNAVTVAVDTHNEIKIDSLSVEYEITEDSTFSKHVKLSPDKIDKNEENKILETSKCSNATLKSIKFDDLATQEDIFTGVDDKHNDYVKVTEATSDADTSGVQATAVASTSLDSLQFNNTNDSITEDSSKKDANSETLEDTVDVANLTDLNSSTNSEEIFCGKLIRTSTKATENVQEQDTLPVTDSVFSSLPLSQDSQNTNDFNAEIPHPELLDSVHPIYPTLTVCEEPISSIIEHLTNPLWVQHLSKYFTNRNVHTISDLARLSEREINRIPVKGNSKVEFVKSILRSFEKTHIEKKTSNVKEDIDDVLNNKVACSVNTNVPASMLLNEPSSSTAFDNVPATDRNTETSMATIESNSNESSDASVVDVFIVDPQIRYESTTQTSALLGFSSVSKSANVTATQSTNVPISSLVTSAPESVMGNTNSSTTSATGMVQDTKTVGTHTNSDSVYLSKTVTNKASKSVGAQMALEDLLDEIDVNLVLESAARRCTPEKLLIQYKNKMRHVPQVELESETIRMLGVENRNNCNEITLKAACRACGVNKVLLRLPDIFSADKQFFVKVLNAYRKKIRTSDCMNILDFNEVKDYVYQKCTSSELAEMLSNKLKEEEQQGIRTPMTELSSLDAMLKRMPMDVIISHTVANDELIPSPVVLDIALQNNSPGDIAQALESQSFLVTKNVFDKLWSSQFAIEHIDQFNKSKEDLLKIFKAVSSKIDQQDLLQVFYESMNSKLMIKQEKD